MRQACSHARALKGHSRISVAVVDDCHSHLTLGALPVVQHVTLCYLCEHNNIISWHLRQAWCHTSSYRVKCKSLIQWDSCSHAQIHLWLQLLF